MSNTANKLSGEIMDEQLRSNLTSSKHWVRFLYMILFAFFLYIASFLMVVIVIVQFAFALLSGAENAKLRVFGRELTTYINQMLLFLTYNSDYKPFPFADWPSAPVEVETHTVAVREPEVAGGSLDNEPDRYEPGSDKSDSYQSESYPSESNEAESYESDSYKSESYKTDSYKTEGSEPVDDYVPETDPVIDSAPIIPPAPGAIPSGTDGGIVNVDDDIRAGGDASRDADDLDETLEPDARFGQTGFTENDDIVRDEVPGEGGGIIPPAGDDEQAASSRKGRSRRT